MALSRREDSIPQGWSAMQRTKTANTWGMTTLYTPETTTVADIVFVHGIRGDPEKTWATKHGGNNGLWLETLLPQCIPDARILTFGYDVRVASISTAVSGSRIGNHAKNLLSALAACRVSEDEINRPIIFVAHSMGGLVCEDALVSASLSAESHLRKILDRTWGILFLGTPHSGTGLAVWAERFAMWLGLVKKTNHQVVNILRRDSELLGRIQDDFHSMVRSRLEGGRKIRITCFYEELPTTGVGEVVSQTSATLAGYTAIGIHATHQGMVRFSSGEDAGFKSITGELQRWISDINESTLETGPLGPNSEPAIAEPSSIGKGRSVAGIVIMGDVKQSNIIGGHQTVWGGMKFGS